MASTIPFTALPLGSTKAVRFAGRPVARTRARGALRLPRAAEGPEIARERESTPPRFGIVHDVRGGPLRLHERDRPRHLARGAGHLTREEASRVNPVLLALARAERRLLCRLEDPAQKLDAGEDSWSAHCETSAALATVTSQLRPESSDRLLTTAELASRLQVSTKTIAR